MQVNEESVLEEELLLHNLLLKKKTQKNVTFYRGKT